MVPRLFITSILFPASRGGVRVMGSVVGEGVIFFPASRGCWSAADSVFKGDLFPRCAGIAGTRIFGIRLITGIFSFLIF
jgi:hypothetical protein